MRRRRFLLGTLGASLAARAAAGGLGTLANILRDGLWIRELPDGKPHRLVAGTKIDSPRFSPTGEWIAYFASDVLHVIPVQGGAGVSLGVPNRGTATPGFQWSPDGRRLVVDIADGLKFYDADDRWRRVVRTITGASLPVAFEPGGRNFVYGDAQVKGRGPGGEPMRTGRLCRLSLGRSGSKPDVLGSQYLSGKIPFAWTPGGDILYWEDPDFSSSAIADGLELFRIPEAGGRARSLGISTFLHGDTLALAPGGGRLAASTGGGRNDWEEKRIVVIDLASGAKSYRTANSVAAVCPAWSPDGSTIAYSAAPDPGRSIGGGDAARRLLAQRRIWVVDAAAGKPPRQLTNDAHYRDEEPMWSADGRHILFCRMTGDDTKELWMMAADGVGVARVAGPLYIDPGPLGSDDSWFGYYGYISWGDTFDWFRGA